MPGEESTSGSTNTACSARRNLICWGRIKSRFSTTSSIPTSATPKPSSPTPRPAERLRLTNPDPAAGLPHSGLGPVRSYSAPTHAPLSTKGDFRQSRMVAFCCAVLRARARLCGSKEVKKTAHHAVAAKLILSATVNPPYVGLRWRASLGGMSSLLFSYRESENTDGGGGGGGAGRLRVNSSGSKP